MANIKTINCDYCKEPAIKNMQREWVEYDLVGSEQQIENCLNETQDNADALNYIDAPEDQNNKHLCAKHLQLFITGEI